MAPQAGEWRRKMCRARVLVTLVVLLIGFQYLMNVLIHQRTYWPLNYARNSTDSAVLRFTRINVTTTTRTVLVDCPIIPPGLKGRVTVNTQIAAWTYLEEMNSHLLDGGYFRPHGCRARHRVAIVIPYRDREAHLKIFLQNIHPFLQRQQLEYRIFVVEMAADVKFNRALLMNVGFLEALKLHDFQCFIFHDVDLLPEDDRNLYSCPRLPRHMSVAIDTLRYALPYAQIFGGVSALTKKHFETLNGFSNIFFGWGGEDDDMYRRIIYSNLTVTRYAPKVARYKMLVHKKDTGNPERFSLLKTVRARQLTDGINSLKYAVLRHENKRLFTWILVTVNMTDILREEPIHMLARNKGQRLEALKKLGVNISNSANAAEVNARLRKRLLQLRKIPLTQFKKNKHVTIDWVPAEFTGKVPVNLTKFDIPVLPVLRPKVQKNVPQRQRLSKGKNAVENLAKLPFKQKSMVLKDQQSPVSLQHQQQLLRQRQQASQQQAKVQADLRRRQQLSQQDSQQQIMEKNEENGQQQQIAEEEEEEEEEGEEEVANQQHIEEEEEEVVAQGAPSSVTPQQQLVGGEEVVAQRAPPSVTSQQQSVEEEEVVAQRAPSSVTSQQQLVEEEVAIQQAHSHVTSQQQTASTLGGQTVHTEAVRIS